MKIIDASVALKWFVNEPAGQKTAEQVLQQVESDPRLFGVPELFFAEMLHVLCRIFKEEKRVKEAMTILETLGFERIGFGHELLQLATGISLKYEISGYDAIYVASAKLLKGQWYTFDQKAHQKINKLNVSTLLC